jgi:BirA family biotin operon repressor/biotin-[acetyl-CoA-carboxylase] ligase
MLLPILTEKGYKLQIFYLDRIDSTQRYLKSQLSAKKLNAPIAVCADEQSEGMGSRQNKWISQRGNLFFSFALRLDSLPNDLKIESASIYFSYILKEVLASYGSKVWIKWPNDFYINEKKIGGTITHISHNHLICGIGLNLIISPKNHSTLDIIVKKENLLKDYFVNIEKKVLWKQVFSKYKLEFYQNRDVFTHINGAKIILKDVNLNDDGSLEINGERIYSLR